MKHKRKQLDRRGPIAKRRRGLATLEMVLALPILLFIMALMINFGTLACWKVRSLSMAREAVWSTRWPRTGNSNPRPNYWPQGAGTRTAAEDNVDQLDDPRADLPVARGPLPFGTEVNGELLNPGRGLRRGSASITRGYPMLGKLGNYDLEANTYLLDDKWQHLRMGLNSTRQRRMPVIYVLSKASTDTVAAYTQAVLAVLNTPLADALRPMDNDEEYQYYGQRFNWGTRSPDFYPRLQRFCSLDYDLATERVDKHVERIEGKAERDADGQVTRRVSGVPERMTKSFISLYKRVIRAIESSGGEIGTETTTLQAKIDTLERFLQLLQNN